MMNAECRMEADFIPHSAFFILSLYDENRVSQSLA